MVNGVIYWLGTPDNQDYFLRKVLMPQGYSLFNIVNMCNIIATKTVDGLPYLSTLSHSAIKNLLDYLLFLSLYSRVKVRKQYTTSYCLFKA